MTRVAARARGFTLVELTIALVLMAAIAALLYGSLSLAARTWDGGEAKMQQVSDLRTTQTYLRAQIAAQYPQRHVEDGRSCRSCSAASATKSAMRRCFHRASPREASTIFALPSCATATDRCSCRSASFPTPTRWRSREFRDAERSILAEDIAELRIAYFGRAANAADTEAPTWLDRWDDKQRLPLLVRIDVKPEKGAAWPTLVVEPRRSPEAGCPAWDPADESA